MNEEEFNIYQNIFLSLSKIHSNENIDEKI